ncbi:hypothetical protein [Flavobacterium sp. GCM10027622]|uniref:hypothetical protein n=1 Tax=unclassified Flavobacterium TaxID=196869 RepID=UPI00361BBA01
MKFRYIVLLIVIVIGFLSVVLFKTIKDADIDYKYGEFSPVFHQYDSAKSYFVVIDEKETGFLLKYGDALLVENNKCMTHLTDYSPSQIEVYQFLPEKTFDVFTLQEVKELKKRNSTKLVFVPVKH